MDDMNLIATGCLQGQIKRVSNILSPHVGAKFPRDNVAAVVVEDRAEIEPPPAQNFEISEVCLPQLVDGCGFVFELAGRFDHDEGRAGDQVERLQDTICRSL